ncbi:class C sortase [Clostridium perfringens]|uniref:class C sortase n=1 Tax=Clostridium perfringens TaxID=1502 RepID=UPI0026E3C4E3|nr:class C sortase [Clostridium perfringens]MDM0633719.1 class C sortase [Clostridium perfringens]MDM0701845.1 class C sortase [Clostridium perfringens]MDO6338498.1 class C sortase [Clostridium perfringens]MDY2582390.1 class C sortase [Clostridium perfringens]
MVSKKKFKNKIFDCMFLVVAVIGVALLVYPFYSDYKLGKSQEMQIEKYTSKVGQMSEDEKKKILKTYEEQNGNNSEIISEDPFNKSNSVSSIDLVKAQLPDVIAILEIPKINLKVQVYPTTNEMVLREGIGVLDGTSLPIGGDGNHSVLTGHSGLSLENMFTNLHELELGDHFYINILGEVHAYEVDRIQTVLPDDTSHFEKELDKDYITLVTCTPLGVNSHRLLVRGHRVQYNLDKFDNRDNDINLNKNNLKKFFTLKTFLIISIIIFILFIILIIVKKKNYQINFKK